MNAFYRKVATYLNNLQNHRTDTQVHAHAARSQSPTPAWNSPPWQLLHTPAEGQGPELI